MRRSLPSHQDALLILGRGRTRPPAPPPPLAARALAPTIRTLEARFGRGAAGLKARWREIVGEVLARRTEPMRLSRPRAGQGASLEIRVEGAAAVLMQHQAPEILARVNLFLGKGEVDRLRISQGPVSPRTPRPLVRHPARREPPAPLGADEEAALEQTLGAMAEGPLRQALTGLGRAVLRRGS
jgi:hypothetical protein